MALEAGARVKVVHVPQHFEWLLPFLGREGIVRGRRLNGYLVDFDLGGSETFHERELELIKEVAR